MQQKNRPTLADSNKWPLYAQPVADDVRNVGGGNSAPEQVVHGGGGGGPPVDRELERHVDKSMETVKAQNDARFAEVITSIDKVNFNLSAFGETVKIRLESIDADTKAAKSAAERAETEAKTTRRSIIGTAIAVVGVLLAVWAIWVQGIEMVSGLLK